MDLKVSKGITPNQINDLIFYSNNDQLIKLTTHDLKRFKDQEAYNEWSKKKRTIYTLVDKSQKLFGIIWFGKEQFPKNKKLTENIIEDKYTFTFAIRIYSNARGKGYANMFVNNAFKLFKETNEYKDSLNKGFWLQTYISNLPAIKTYNRFGFITVSKPDEEHRILMILPNSF